MTTSANDGRALSFTKSAKTFNGECNHCGEKGQKEADFWQSLESNQLR